MALDPFPNTSDPTLEQRLRVLFDASSSLICVPIDPPSPKQGQLWLNTTTKELKLFSEGLVWTLGKASVSG